MKKFVAAGLSAVLCLGMAVPSFAEGTVSEELEEIGSVYAGMGVSGELSFDGMGLSAGLSVSNSWDAAGNSALSVDVNALGESLAIEDLIRIVDGGLYVNVAGIVDVANAVTGEDFSSYTALVGVGDWLYIPPMDFSLDGINFELGDLDGLDSLLEDVAYKALEAFSPISMDFTDDATVIHLTDADVAAIADNLDGVISEVLTGTDNLPAVSLSIDRSFFEQFGEYVEAFAEGRAAVTGEETADVVEEVYGYTDLINMYIEMMLESFDPSELLGDLSVRSLVDSILDGTTFDLTVTIPDDGEGYNLAGTIDETPLDLTLSATENAGYNFGGFIGDGEEIVTIDVTVDPLDDETFIITGTVAEGDEVLTIDGSLTEGEDGSVSYYVTLAEGETELASVIVDVTPSEDDSRVDIVYAASVQGEELFDIVGYIAESDEGFEWNFDAIVEGESMIYSGYVQETEDGVAVNCTVDLGEEGSMAVNGALGFTITPDDYVVEVPEDATSLVDVVRDVTTLYYSLTAIDEE